MAKSKNYLVLGTVERGYSMPVLKVLKQVQKKTKATVVITGSLVTQTEKEMYDRRAHKVRTWEKLGTKADWNQQKWSTLHREQMQVLVEAQNERMRDMIDMFGKNTIFVSNDELYIKDGMALSVKPVSHLDLSRYLTITPVAPNGPKVSGNPITPRGIKMYRYYRNSVVAPHPVFATRLFPKEGENKAYQFMTTGALRFPKNAKRQSETFEHFSHPGAVLITLNEETGQFYHQRIAVDKTKNGEVFAVWDGLLFTPRIVRELSAAHRRVTFTDSHGKYKNIPTWESAKKLCELFKPGGLIHNSDLGDFGSICPHVPFDHADHDGSRLADDLALFLRDCKELAALTPELVVTEGNHHEWLNRFVSGNKVLVGLLGFPQIQDKLRAEGLNITLREDQTAQSAYRFFDLVIDHGHKGINGNKKGKSVIQLSAVYDKAVNGHFHTHEEFMNAIRMGCSCNLIPYMKGDVDQWILQIGTITAYNGCARLHVKTVMTKNGITTFGYRGQIVEFKPSNESGRNE